ncbi:MAG TPA: ankyrin repeat domain-containing protein [Gallionellaceae bacterium]|nr:ankyrin repeat domain-containing protein [Gallionellaceae bacterium]
MSAELFNAVLAGDVVKATALLKSGADCNASNEEGASLLMLAAGAGHFAMVEMLIEAGAKVDATDARGWTPLMKALFNYELNRGFPDVVSALIDAGADIEHQVSYGTRPLMIAAGYGEAGVVDVLLAAGADTGAMNEGGRTARTIAETKDYVEVVNQLHMHDLRNTDGKKSGCSSGASKTAPGVNVVNFVRKPLH